MNVRVMVATPTYTGQVFAEYVRSLNAAMLYSYTKGVELHLAIADGYSLIQFARNRLAQDFLDETSMTHILWLDADLGFDPRAIAQLVEHGVDVVGGAYPVKTFPPWFPVETEAPATLGLQRCKTLPTGFLLCTRKAMETVAAEAPIYLHHHKGEKIPTRHIFDLELRDNGPGEPKDLVGEDVLLCTKLRRAGFDLWLDPDINFTHHGNHHWGANMARTLEREQRETPAQAQLRDSVAKAMGYIDRDAPLPIARRA
jgi:hypothetical protein